MTQTPDGDSFETTDNTEIDLGPIAENGETDSDINLDFADFSQEASDEDIEIDLGAQDQEADDDEESPLDLSSLLSDDDQAVDDDQQDVSDEDELADDQDEALAKALEELHDELVVKPGDWFVVHTYSGMENRVKQNIDNRVKSLNMEDFIYETVVPTEEAVEMRNGQKKTVTRVYLPGYVLVRMDMTDESWSTVRHTPSVTGFVGQAQTPTPLGLDEVEHMLTPSVVAKVTVADKSSQRRSRQKVEVVDYAVGDQVMVIDGPFAGVHATITEINTHNQRLKANVEILGRETPVDLTFPQIQKVVE